MRWLVLLVLGALVMGAWSPRATADRRPEEEARVLFKEGNRRLQAGDYLGALERYRAAKELSPSAKILVNLGAALVKLGRHAEAIEMYEQYLQHKDADPGRTDAIQRLIATFEQELAVVVVTVTEPGATVFLDEREMGVGRGPWRLRLAPGRHTVGGEHAGFAPQTVVVEGVAGTETRVELALVRLVAQALPPPSSTRDSPVPSVDVAPNSRIVAVARKSPASAWRLGALVHGTMEPQGQGGVIALAAVLGGRHIDLFAGGFWGATAGVTGGARTSLATGSVRPVFALSLPLFYAEGSFYPAVHGGAGVSWRSAEGVEMFAELGIDGYLSVPKDFPRWLLVPSLGILVRRP